MEAAIGKRSPGFERRERDFYPTPRAAVSPLIPHLRGIRTFAEPCCGDGSLVRHLESFGLRCGYQGDIADGEDALARDSYGDIDAIVTNPPYERRLMHELIAHFQTIAPTWLLLEADWSQTKQAIPFMRTCTDFVSIGRLKWIEETDMSGKDNFAWYRFDARHSGGTFFHTRESGALRIRSRLCTRCGEPYRPQRSTALYCSDACRQRAHRARAEAPRP